MSVLTPRIHRFKCKLGVNTRLVPAVFAGSWDVERSRAFKELLPLARIQLSEHLSGGRLDTNLIERINIDVFCGGPKRDVADENTMDGSLNDRITVSIDNRGYRGVGMCIRVIRSRISSSFENVLTDRVDGWVLEIPSSLLDVVHGRLLSHSWFGGSR